MINKKIRFAKEDDLISMLDIYGPFITNTTVTFEYDIPTIDEFRQRMHSISEKFPWLVCEMNGKVVGYAYATKHRDRAAYQWSVDLAVYVNPEYHRKHIANALYSALIEILKLQGYYNAYAGITVPNEKSKVFHESFGFKPIGKYRNVGYKFDKWLDVEWFSLEINTHISAPAIPKPITELYETKELQAILDFACGLLIIKSP